MYYIQFLCEALYSCALIKQRYLMRLSKCRSLTREFKIFQDKLGKKLNTLRVPLT